MFLGSAKGILAQMTKYPRKGAPAKDKLATQSETEDRRNPERYVETFKKPLRKVAIPKPISIMKSARFLPHGGKVNIEGQEVKLYNTCNIDNVMVILYLLYTYRPVCHDFIDASSKTDPISAHLVAMII
jgi:hypothetical protein